MEQLRSAFDQAQASLSLVLQHTEQYECLSEQDIFSVLSSLDFVTKEQKRCIQELCEQTGCNETQCTSLQAMQEIRQQYLIRCRQETEAKKRRDTVRIFCSITGEGDYGLALDQVQKNLAGCSDEELKSLSEAGELDFYSQFIECVRHGPVLPADAEIFISKINAIAAFGLVAGKYVLNPSEVPEAGEARPEQAGEETSSKLDDDVPEPPVQTSDTDAAREPDAEEPEVTEEDVPVNVPETTVEEEQSAEVPDDEQPPEDDEARCQLEAELAEVCLDSSEWPEFLVGKPTRKPKGEAAFLSHMRKAGAGVYSTAIMVAGKLLQYWAQDYRDFQRELKVPDQILDSALRFLDKEGYLYTYSLQGENNPLYLLSAAGFKVLTKPGMFKHLNLRKRQFTFLDPLEKMEYIRLREASKYQYILQNPKFDVIIHTFTNSGYVGINAVLDQDSSSNEIYTSCFLPLCIGEGDTAAEIQKFLKNSLDDYQFAAQTAVILMTPKDQQTFWLEFCRKHFLENAQYYTGCFGEDHVCDSEGRSWSLTDLLCRLYCSGDAQDVSEESQEEACVEEPSESSREEAPVKLPEEKESDNFSCEEAPAELPEEEESVELSREEAPVKLPEEEESDDPYCEDEIVEPVFEEEAVSPSSAEKPMKPAFAEKAVPEQQPDKNPAGNPDDASDDPELPLDSRTIVDSILSTGSMPSRKQARDLVLALLAEGQIMEGTLFADTLPLCYRDSDIQNLSNDLIYATHLPLKALDYSHYLVEEQVKQSTLTRFCRLAAAAWTLCFPQRAYDYELYLNAETLVAAALPEWLPEHLVSAKNLMGMLTDGLKNLSIDHFDGLGLSDRVLDSLASDAVMERKRCQLMSAAQEQCRAPRSNINIVGYETMMKASMGPAGELGKCMQAVASDDLSKLSFVQDTVRKFLQDNGRISDAAVISYLNSQWDIQRSKDRTITLKKFGNGSAAQRNYCREITRRLDIACEWLRRNNGSSAAFSTQHMEQIKQFVEQLEALLEQILGDTDRCMCSADREAAAGLQVFRYTIARILSVIRGESDAQTDARTVFAPLLTTPCITLQDDGVPMLDPSLQELPGMEPWRLVIRHLAAPKLPLSDVLDCLENQQTNSERFEDYGSADIIRTVLNLPHPDCRTRENAACVHCDKLETEFCGDIRLACAYGQLAEEAKETTFAQIEKYRALFIPPVHEAGVIHENLPGNYAHYRMVLQCLRKNLETAKERMFRQYEAEYQTCLSALAERPPILEKAHREIRNYNFAMAEEYLVRFHAGELDLPADDSYQDEFNFHAQFLSCADEFCEECEKLNHKGAPLSKWAPRALQHRNFWTSSNERNAQSPTEFWITRKDDPGTPARILRLMGMLGIKLAGVAKSRSHPTTQQYEVFEAEAVPLPCNREDYSHPVKMFGTQMKSPMYIVCTYGCKGASTLIDIMANKLQLGNSVLVLMDGALTLLERRKVAAKFKRETSGQNSFLLIDRVLMLYLSALDSGNRNKALLQCTLPYTYAQLYVTAAGAAADEMFIGRLADRKSLSDPEGACLVYGGRQLGKTALLRRVESINNVPEKKYYSVYIDIKEHGSAYFLNLLCAKLHAIAPDGKPLVSGTETSLEEICSSLVKRGSCFNQLLVLIDEVDAYFKELAQENYNPLHPVVVMQDALKNKVKFVFAGTHNVAATRQATEDNSDLIKLRPPLCIQPLSKADATKLIRKPLSYLGFEIGDQQIALILANTNSYPGLIHLFCNALVKSVCEHYDQNYSETRANPPYTVSDDQLRMIFRETDIKKEIANRVIATIKLDPQYRVVSNLLAFLEYEAAEAGNTRLYGYSSQEIQNCNSREFGIPEFMPDAMNPEDLEVLMDEMERMGILWKNRNTATYRFRQRDFIGYIGTPDMVMQTLLEENRL